MGIPQQDLILVLDRAPDVRKLLFDLLATEGYRVIAPESLPEDPHEVAQVQPVLVILDHFLGAASPGWQLLCRLRTNAATRSIPILVCTAAIVDVRARESELAALGVGVVRKPFALDEFLGAVRRAVGASQADGAPGPVPGLPGISPVRLYQESGEVRGSDLVW